MRAFEILSNHPTALGSEMPETFTAFFGKNIQTTHAGDAWERASQRIFERAVRN